MPNAADILYQKNSVENHQHTFPHFPNLSFICVCLHNLRETIPFIYAKKSVMNMKQPKRPFTRFSRKQNAETKGNSLEFIAHVILEKQSGNVPKGTKKKLQESYRYVLISESLLSS
ncbi:hypothetical protein [Prevotella sp.]|uniref:hypothetical protein n=1 Tax=Prevotella sp. TaxID=59823 RepID=UPI0026487F2C|nr:hypothetical protein [Prevotella sp.]MDN5554345.1 hypothetical protein [Prevotella sp.]